jgi:hypothetical protein
MRSTILAVALLAAVCASAPLSPSVQTAAPHYHCMFQVDEDAKIEPSAAVAFTLSLRQRNIEILERTVLDVSDPDSPRYGQYLSTEELEELTRPAEHHYAAVTQWLENNGERKVGGGIGDVMGGEQEKARERKREREREKKTEREGVFERCKKKKQ